MAVGSRSLCLLSSTPLGPVRAGIRSVRAARAARPPQVFAGCPTPGPCGVFAPALSSPVSAPIQLWAGAAALSPGGVGKLSVLGVGRSQDGFRRRQRLAGPDKLWVVMTQENEARGEQAEALGRCWPLGVAATSSAALLGGRAPVCTLSLGSDCAQPGAWAQAWHLPGPGRNAGPATASARALSKTKPATPCARRLHTPLSISSSPTGVYVNAVLK